jgi:ABC-type nitrate/sulfonate/bicarbonate transport system permease component
MAAIAVLSIAGLVLYAIIAVAETWAVYWQAPAELGGSGGG